MTPLKKRIAELRALSEKATPGEWKRIVPDDPNADEQVVWPDTGYVVAKTRAPNNAAFIAASRTALPQLLLVVEELVRGLEEVSGESHSEMCNLHDGPRTNCSCFIRIACDALTRAEAHFAERGRDG